MSMNLKSFTSAFFVRAAGAIVLTVIFASVSFLRNNIWSDEVTLWRDAAYKSPQKARSYVNIGAALIKAGKNQEALEPLKKSISIEPAKYEAYRGLGSAYINLGRFVEAAAALSTAVQFKSNSAETYNDLGVVLVMLGNHAGAVEAFKKALSVDPSYAEANANLANEYRVVGLPVRNASSFPRGK